MSRAILPLPRPAHLAPASPTAVRVAQALQRAILRLRADQAADGAWRSDCDQGPAVTAQAALALAWVQAPLDPAQAEAVCRWLVSRQLSDGGWATTPFSETAELGTTATCWAALVRLGCTDAAAVARAAQATAALGGLEVLSSQIREADTAAWFVAMSGLLPATLLPRMPLRWRQVDFLARWLEDHVHDGVQLLITQLAAIQRSLSGAWGTEARRRGEAAAVVALLDTYQNPDGSWGGFVPIHALGLAAMHACGERGSRLQRGIAWLQGRLRQSPDGMWFSAYDPDIWVTGITVRALRLAGVEAADPAIQGGVRWLLQGQSTHTMPRALQRQRGAPRTGGWAFGGRSPVLADTDDTGIAMLALSMCTDLPGTREAIAAGQEYLLAMQNPDGGFPAFTWNVGRRTVQPPRLLPPGQAPRGLRERLVMLRQLSMNLSDPPAEDLTGRVLRALAACGFSHRDAVVQRTVGWLTAAQSPSGGWWGKWVTPYMVPTADVLSGLQAVGLPLETPAVQAGLGFLLARQQDDGGWGDTCAAYLDPQQAGRAPSSCPVTAWVLTGLLPWLGADHPAVLRGVRYLLDRQQDDGGWPNGIHTHVYLPPDRTYVLPATALMHSVEALALWQRLVVPGGSP